MTVKSILPAENRINNFPSGKSVSSKRILLVEYDVDVRQINSSSLKNAGYEVDAFEDGAHAWDAIERNHYDLMITDQHMPKLSGVELLRKIYEAHLALPVIMATAILPTWEFALNPWLQTPTMLQKPYQIAELLTMVKTVLLGPVRAHTDNQTSSNQQNRTVTVDLCSS